MTRFSVRLMTNWIEKTLYSNGTLKNKLHIHDADKLAQIEYRESAKNIVYLLARQPKIKNLADLQKIHSFMFGELYDWAGQYRPGNFQKDDYIFFDFHRFQYAITDINALIKQMNAKEVLSKLDYAKLLDEINYMHPFREGNGRGTKVFLQCIAANHQQVLNYPRKNNEMIKAQQDSDLNAIANLLKLDNSPSQEIAYHRIIDLHKDN